MSTELTTLQASKFLALRPDSGVMEAVTANLGEDASFEESMFNHVKIPAGGATNWTIEGAGGEEVTPSIEGVLVYLGKGGVLFPNHEPSEGTLPLLRTDDWRTAYQVGDDFGDINPAELEKYSVGEGLYDWERLPWNQFGSGKNNTGKRCKNYYVLGVLRESDALPLVIRATPGSLKAVEKFRNSLISAGVPHYKAVVAVGLEAAKNATGQRFSRITIRMTEKLSDAEAGQIRRLYTEPMREAVRKIDVGFAGDE